MIFLIVNLEKRDFSLYLFNIIIIKIIRNTDIIEYNAPLEFEKETITNSKNTLIYINTFSLYVRVFLLLTQIYIEININDASKIVEITSNTYTKLPYDDGTKKMKYVVTALDRMSNESKIAKKKVKL